MLNSLFLYAKKREIEKDATPLWLAQFIVKKIQKEDPISYEDFIHSILNTNPSSVHERRSPQDITKDFQVVVNACRKKEGLNG